MYSLFYDMTFRSYIREKNDWNWNWYGYKNVKTDNNKTEQNEFELFKKSKYQGFISTEF